MQEKAKQSTYIWFNWFVNTNLSQTSSVTRSVIKWKDSKICIEQKLVKYGCEFWSFYKLAVASSLECLIKINKDIINKFKDNDFGLL